MTDSWGRATRPGQEVAEASVGSNSAQLFLDPEGWPLVTALLLPGCHAPKSASEESQGAQEVGVAATLTG